MNGISWLINKKSGLKKNITETNYFQEQFIYISQKWAIVIIHNKLIRKVMSNLNI